MRSNKKNYTIKENYFKTWSHDMAYILGFIVADGCLREDGYYIKIDISPKDVSVLNFIKSEITPDYELKYTSRGTEVRWYPSSFVMKEDLMQLGVKPAKTGNEVVPDNLPQKYFWDFVRGYFDGDGCVEDCCIKISCNSQCFLDCLQESTTLGYVKPDRMNFRWIVEQDEKLSIFYEKLYDTGSFCLERKRLDFDHLVNYVPEKVGRFSLAEDFLLKENRNSHTRRELAKLLGRTSTSIKCRLGYLKIKKD